MSNRSLLRRIVQPSGTRHVERFLATHENSLTSSLSSSHLKKNSNRSKIHRCANTGYTTSFDIVCVIKRFSSSHSNQHPHLPFSRFVHPKTDVTLRKLQHDEVRLHDVDDDVPLFSKVFIANRGEIARRIIKTCHLHNIETVAVYTTLGDSMYSPHVREASHSICLGSNSKSFLDIDLLCDTILNSGADAVHPGYGFLSENAEFSDRVSQLPLSSSSSLSDRRANTRKNVTFIGPTGEAIRMMGNKLTSKQLAREAGVSIVPGCDEALTSHQLQRALEIANTIISYPVMIKALAGGGGKGMRICYNDSELKDGFTLSTAEAQQFFKDERVFLEKYVENPHHIEFQVLAGRKKRPDTASVSDSTTKAYDDEGDLEVICFPERECSIQRRNQKIIEESPSCLLHPITRRNMVRQVKSLIRQVNYTSAGTVEFLVDENQNFYFLEMNTRLQVEHPVTEVLVSSPMPTLVNDEEMNIISIKNAVNIDLVKGMIDVAAGRGVPKEWVQMIERSLQPTDADLEGAVMPFKGHAIEARIYAEDPLRGFLPSTGNLLKYVEPPTGHVNHSDHYIRVDSGVVAGCAISPYYDPMISKLVAYSPSDRETALHVLGDALDRYVIQGVEHNMSFVSNLLRIPEFHSGDTPTNFISKHFPSGFAGVQLTHEELYDFCAVAATVTALKQNTLCDFDASTEKHNEIIVLLGGMFGDAFSVKRSTRGVVVHPTSSSDKNINQSVDRVVSIELLRYDLGNSLVDVIINGVERAVQIQVENNCGLFKMRMLGAQHSVLVMSKREYELSRFMKKPLSLDNSDFILSPMPGMLIRYAVEEGDQVEIGQEICVVEAMKMQNILRSHRKGTVKRIYAIVGHSLKADEIVIEFSKDS